MLSNTVQCCKMNLLVWNKYDCADDVFYIMKVLAIIIKVQTHAFMKHPFGLAASMFLY